MIPHLFHERNQLLGKPIDPPAPSDGTLPPRPSGEPPAEERRRNPKSYFGFQNSFEILPSLGLTFADLRAAYDISRRPILDVGASHSTLALEGSFHGIPIFSTDLCAEKIRLGILTTLERRINLLEEVYVGEPKHRALHMQKFPPGFECEPIRKCEWKDAVARGINHVNQTLSECDASRIRLADGHIAPDRSFSLVLSSHAVPKYSVDEKFLRTELRELLRVTAGRLVLFPFIAAGPEHELLHRPHSPTRKMIEDTARELGFAFETKVYPYLIEPEGGPPTAPGYNITAIFSRLGTRYPPAR